MASLWSRATSALHQATIRKVAIVGVIDKSPYPRISFPFQLGDKFITEQLRTSYLLGTRASTDNNGWCYPLVGTLYVAEQYKIAVYGEDFKRDWAVRALSGHVSCDNFGGDGVCDNEVDEYIVLANGKLCTPEEGALIQNTIRRAMMEKMPDLCRGTDKRVDRVIRNSIDHTLMFKYYQEIAPLFNLRQSGQPLK